MSRSLVWKLFILVVATNVNNFFRRCLYNIFLIRNNRYCLLSLSSCSCSIVKLKMLLVVLLLLRYYNNNVDILLSQFLSNQRLLSNYFSIDPCCNSSSSLSIIIACTNCQCNFISSFFIVVLSYSFSLLCRDCRNCYRYFNYCCLCCRVFEVEQITTSRYIRCFVFALVLVLRVFRTFFCFCYTRVNNIKS